MPLSEDIQSQTEQQTTDKDQKPSAEVKTVIVVGDKVIVDDCPAYWSWASPFVVEAIDGGMAKLEMVGAAILIMRIIIIILRI